jgi:hypothetical protein
MDAPQFGYQTLGFGSGYAGLSSYTPVDGQNDSTKAGSIGKDMSATNPDNTTDVSMEFLNYQIDHDETWTNTCTLTGLGTTHESLVHGYFFSNKNDIGTHTGTWKLSIGGTEVLSQSTTSSYNAQYGRNLTADTCAIVGSVHQVDDAGSGSSNKDKFWIDSPVIGGAATQGSNGPDTTPVLVAQAHIGGTDISGSSLAGYALGNWYEALGGSDTLQHTVDDARFGSYGTGEPSGIPATSDKMRIWANARFTLKDGTTVVTFKYYDYYAASPSETTFGTATFSVSGVTHNNYAYVNADIDASGYTPSSPGGALHAVGIKVYAKSTSGSPRLGANSQVVAGLAREPTA